MERLRGQRQGHPRQPERSTVGYAGTDPDHGLDADHRPIPSPQPAQTGERLLDKDRRRKGGPAGDPMVDQEGLGPGEIDRLADPGRIPRGERLEILGGLRDGERVAGAAERIPRKTMEPAGVGVDRGPVHLASGHPGPGEARPIARRHQSGGLEPGRLTGLATDGGVDPADLDDWRVGTRDPFERETELLDRACDHREAMRHRLAAHLKGVGQITEGRLRMDPEMPGQRRPDGGEVLRRPGRAHDDPGDGRPRRHRRVGDGVFADDDVGVVAAGGEGVDAPHPWTVGRFPGAGGVRHPEAARPKPQGWIRFPEPGDAHEGAVADLEQELHEGDQARCGLGMADMALAGREPTVARRGLGDPGVTKRLPQREDLGEVAFADTRRLAFDHRHPLRRDPGIPPGLTDHRGLT